MLYLEAPSWAAASVHSPGKIALQEEEPDWAAGIEEQNWVAETVKLNSAVGIAKRVPEIQYNQQIAEDPLGIVVFVAPKILIFVLNACNNEPKTHTCLICISRSCSWIRCNANWR